MQINRVIFPFTNAKIGGSHISSFALGTCLQDEHGVEVVVAAPSRSLIVDVARDKGYTVWQLPEKPAFRHGPLREAQVLPARLRRLAGQPSGTIVHANDISALQSWGPAARMRGLPVVYHNRAFNRTVPPNLLAMATAHRIVCISRAVEARLPGWLARRAQRIDNPFELELSQDRKALRHRFEAEFPSAAAGPLIGFIGNFAERKRPRYFLDVAHALSARCPQARFVVFGREVDMSEADLKAYAAERGLADKVIFAGFRMPVEENIVVLDMLAVTAVNEPLGRTPIEALLLGVPYVATHDAGLAETAQRFGGGTLVAREAEPAVFADAILAGLNEANAARLAASREKAIHALSARRHTEAMLALYRGLFPQGRGYREPSAYL